jgi:hypothetical protein
MYVDPGAALAARSRPAAPMTGSLILDIALAAAAYCLLVGAAVGVLWLTGGEREGRDEDGGEHGGGGDDWRRRRPEPPPPRGPSGAGVEPVGETGGGPPGAVPIFGFSSDARSRLGCPSSD